MAEMWTRSPIMQGNTEQHQLTLIAQLCGAITPEVWPGVEKLDLFNKMELPKGIFFFNFCAKIKTLIKVHILAPKLKSKIHLSFLLNTKLIFLARNSKIYLNFHAKRSRLQLIQYWYFRRKNSNVQFSRRKSKKFIFLENIHLRRENSNLKLFEFSR